VKDSLVLKNITKRFADVLALESVCFTLRRGEIHALLGENGAGKTTLMNILYGLVRPDSGEISVRGENCWMHSPLDALAQGIGMVHQHFMLVPTMTVAENIILGQEPTKGPYLLYNEAERLIEQVSEEFGLEVQPNRQVWQLSVGEQQRIEIIKILYRNADILILDEPTAVLTPPEVISLFKTLKSLTDIGKSVVFITHKLSEVMAISDRVTVLRKGRVQGTVISCESNEKELAHLMVGRDVVFSTSSHENMSGDIVASIQQLSANGDHGKLALADIDLDLRAGEIVGVAGVDGNGQGELAQVLAGLRKKLSGNIYIKEQEIVDTNPATQISHGVAYVPSDRKALGVALDLSLLTNSVLKNHNIEPYSRRGILQHSTIRKFTEGLVNDYDIRCPSVEGSVHTLSGGNLQKLILAREISSAPSLLIVEQPTRGLDVGATETIRNLLLEQRDQGAAILLISTDLDEVLTLSNRVVVMYEGSIVYESSSKVFNRDEIGLAMAGFKTTHKEQVVE